MKGSQITTRVIKTVMNFMCRISNKIEWVLEMKAIY